MSELFDDIEIEVTKFEVVPEGIYKVIISGMEKVDGPTFRDPTVMETKIKMEFTIIEGDQKDQKLYQRIRPKLGMGQKLSNLLKLWDAVEGKSHNTEDFDKFKLGSLAGKSLQVVVKEVEKDGKKFSNITDYLKNKTKKEEVDPEELLGGV